MKIEIITRCTRTENLLQIKDSIFNQKSKWDINWNIIFDISAIDYIDCKILLDLKSPQIITHFLKGEPNDFGHGLINKILDSIDNNSWVYILDDDNLLHEDFLEKTYDLINEYYPNDGLIFSQYVGGIDFSKLEIRKAHPDNVKVGKIDFAQFLLKKSLIGDKRLLNKTYVADGIFISELFDENKNKILFSEDILCYYNRFQQLKKQPYTLPRILVAGTEVQEIKSKKIADFESDELYLINNQNNDLIIDDIIKYDPDAIVTIGENYKDFKFLLNLPLYYRQRWIHSLNENNNIGESAYQCAMSYILNSDFSTLVSVFTPAYNTKEKLYRTYESLNKQTYNNWEWVIVNDSTDLITGKIIKEISLKDPRVKSYEFKEKSKGIIGESKYRACVLCKGDYLLELDHDDYLLPNALELMINAFEKYPDAGFVYSDCAEVNEKYESLTYGKGYALGYGYYREEEHLGKIFKVGNTPNINPLTIRHIVGVPNHFRAWKRDAYFKAGGHNRRLSIADDYELIIRTFLTTKMVKIPIGCYLQFFHGDNSQNSTRKDIQRRVRTISQYYNQQIKKRFNELGKVDWAYTEKGNPLMTEPRFGIKEDYVNYIY